MTARRESGRPARHAARSALRRGSRYPLGARPPRPSVYVVEDTMVSATLARHREERLYRADDRDRGTPRGATPPTPPGIRVTYHGGSTGLGLYSRAFGCWLRHDWFGPLVTADPGFTLVRRFQGQ